MTHRRSRWPFLLAPLAALSGCVAVSTTYEGNPIPQEALGRIEVGVTTKAEVLELLGSPLAIDRTDITGLVERALARYQGEELMLKVDPSLFNDVYIYERTEIERLVMIFGFFNYYGSDERSDRLSIFFGEDERVLGIGWTPGREDL